MNIAIIGLGYVGLPLSLQFARNGASVLGLDIDQAKVDSINGGKSYIKHIADTSLQEQVTAGRLRASTDFSEITAIRISPVGASRFWNANLRTNLGSDIVGSPFERPSISAPSGRTACGGTGGAGRHRSI